MAQQLVTFQLRAQHHIDNHLVFDDNDSNVVDYLFDVLPQLDSHWEARFKVNIPSFDVNIEPIFDTNDEIA